MSNYEEQVALLYLIGGKWIMCGQCKKVDSHRQRAMKDSVCPDCGVIETAILYFPTPVHILLDLIRKSATTDLPVESSSQLWEPEENAHNVSILLFFCTLRELLMNHLVHQLYFDKAESWPIYDRLLADNRLYTQKQERLFRTLTGRKWRESLDEIGERAGKDYRGIDEDVKELARIRNDFTHTGHPYEIWHSTSAKCVRTVPRLLELYVDLHNAFLFKPRGDVGDPEE